MPNPILDTNSSRPTVAGAETFIIDRMPALLPGATMSVSGVATTSEQVVSTFAAHRAAMTATDAAKKAYHDAVAAERELYAKARAAAAALQLYIAAVCGANSPTAAALGFEPKPRAEPSAAVKRDAVEKRAATRQARHTMGKRQRAAVKGQPSATASVAREPVAAAVALPDGVSVPAAAPAVVEPSGPPGGDGPG
jgi:hypothetical protein